MIIKTVYVCPSCKSRYKNQREAVACRNKHEINTERWIMCKCGFGVRWFDNVVFETCKMRFDYHKKSECSLRESEAVINGEGNCKV